jgi:hypothetical protein
MAGISKPQDFLDLGGPINATCAPVGSNNGLPCQVPSGIEPGLKSPLLVISTSEAQ